MNEVYVRGCERAYLGPTLDKDVICPRPDPEAHAGAGSLVIHIRSGDIMRGGDTQGKYADYGQVCIRICQHAQRREGLQVVVD